MAYDEKLAERLRVVLKRRRGIEEKKMFGGLAFMLNGNMCCGVNKKNLVLRLGKHGAAEALNEPHTREMDFTGRSLKTMIYVSPTGYRRDTDLRRWVGRAADYAKSLPKK